MSEEIWDFVGLGYPAWVDVPDFSEIQAAPSMGEAGRGLDEQLKSYHALSKVHLDTLLPRQVQLDALAEYCHREAIDTPLAFCWTWLAQLAEGKAAYLGCLQRIFSQGWHRPEQLLAYLSESRSSRWRTLSLTQERYLFPERSVYWGNFAMEALDPCHRQLPDLFKVWREEASETPYLLWLEKFARCTHERWVRYFSVLEQEEKRVSCDQGRLVTVRGRPLNCPERQHYLFVIDEDENLLAARAEAHLCHASFTRGRPVIAAGILQAREGRLVHLKFESGHYLSGPENWWQAFEFFEGMELDVSEPLRVTVFDRFRYVSRKIDRSRIKNLADLKRNLLG